MDVIHNNKMESDEYNEHEVLKNYVLAYFTKYFTPTESLGFMGIVTELKAQNFGPFMAKRIREEWKANTNPEVEEALSQGSEKFRETVFQRLMSDHGEDIFINRCPNCNKIAKTPRAKQCQWCFHDWH